MIFRLLYPITDLIDEKFWKAFWECFHCECPGLTLCCSHVNMILLFTMLGHYHLWVGGAEHNDVSTKNLMYDKKMRTVAF